ncbi:MAG: ABC-F family ATP-binding cassette domain-containing protein [Erysipelotrichaceae bacterium]
MFTVTDVTLDFSGTPLFKEVNLKFNPGNCYGIIGANGAGKSTFLKLLSGELETTKGTISVPEKTRVSVFKQNHYEYDEYSVHDTIMMGNPRLYQIMKEKEALYCKEDFSEEDGILASHLEEEFEELDGWNAETEALRLLKGLGIEEDILEQQMASLTGREKVKVFLASALFGKPEIILLDEPTNHLDVNSINWLEEFLMDYHGTVIVVSHDRHFLNAVCTHIVDIDYGKIKMYVGNYEFWYESSQMMAKLLKDQNRKKEDKIKDLQNFISRFSANKSKAKQATARRKMLDKLTVEEIPASTRRYPFVGFKIDREIGKDCLSIDGLSHSVDGVKVLNNLSLVMGREDKIALVGDQEIAITTLFKILSNEITPDEGSFKWGVSTSQSYFPKDNSEYFDGSTLSILDWLRQYSTDDTETYLRGFLGRMLFSGEEVEKQVKVLSGGEKVRCMLSRMMLYSSNVLLMDQPTNHLDLESITAVNNSMIEFKGALIFASHDHEFIQTIANRIIEVQADGSIIDRRCSYDEFIELKQNT